MMITVAKASILLLLGSPYCFSQNPLPVLGSGWRFSTQKVPKVEVPPTGPARALTDDDKNFQRKVREARTDHPDDPSDTTPDGRRAALDKIEQESRTPQPESLRGYSYSASVRNDSGKTVKVIFWEYRFAELARPANIVRRQFLCAVNLKKGDKTDLTAFSTIGPSDVIDVDSLSKSKEKLFDELVQINRIEFSDDTVLQRGGWKLDDVKSAVERATSTPWGKEICRAL